MLMKHFLITVIALILSKISLSQELPRVVPLPPNAAALTEYADVPVSNCTGVPNISIPIYTIKSGEIELPITLSYHASGIRVAQEASWVGLGWILNSGGVITRQIRGLDDFRSSNSFGYLNSPEIPVAAYYGSEEEGYIYTPKISEPDVRKNLNQLNYIDKGGFDGHPDLFYFNFMGHSGSFFIEKQGHVLEYKATLVKPNGMTISYRPNEKVWKIRDTNGWTYFFGTVEKSITYIGVSQVPFNQENQMFAMSVDEDPGLHPQEEITSWYLDKVISPKGDELKFFYDTDTHSTKGQVSFNETFNDIITHYDVQGNPLPIGHGLGDLYRRLYIGTLSVTDDVYLRSIDFKGGSVSFSTEDRIDLRKHIRGHKNPERLKSIEVLNQKNQTLKKVDFKYSYTTASNENSSMTDHNNENLLRLQLDEVQEFSKKPKETSFTGIPPYKFEYNPTLLPQKTSKKIDFGGFYNDKRNDLVRDRNGVQGVLAPRYIDHSKTYPGADRSAVPEKTKAAVLEKITYPLGGSVNFDFENNTHSSRNSDFEQPFEDVTYHAIDPEGVSECEPDKEDTFVLKEQIKVKLSLNIARFGPSDEELEFPYLTSQLKYFETLFDVTLKRGDQVIYKFLPTKVEDYVCENKEFTLPAGTYTIHASTTHPYTEVSFIAKYIQKTAEPVNKTGTGLRVKQIITKDKDGHIIKRKTYSYEKNGRSTGKKINGNRHIGREFIFDYSVKKDPSTGELHIEMFNNIYLKRSSSEIFSTFSQSQEAIGYDRVIVRNQDSNNNNLGYSEYNYTNFTSERHGDLASLGYPLYRNLLSGLLSSEKHYNTLDKLVSEKRYAYKKIFNKSINGIVINTKKSRVDLGHDIAELCNKLFDDAFFYIGKSYVYPVFSKWIYQDILEEIIYDENGENPIITTTTYEYNNPIHRQITGTITTNSLGEELKTKTYYPDDISNSSPLPGPPLSDSDLYTINSLNQENQHRISIPLQEDTFKDNALINRKRIVYGNTTNTILPKQIQTAIANNALEDRIIYHNYDRYGNLVSVSKANGTPITYIWGYKGMYPIAKIENATFDEVYEENINLVPNLISLSENDTDPVSEQALATAMNTKLRNHSLYKEKWQVTTYTYDPLIGVTSITDPNAETVSYHYDAFGKLEFVKDSSGNILSKTEYQYNK